MVGNFQMYAYGHTHMDAHYSYDPQPHPHPHPHPHPPTHIFMNEKFCITITISLNSLKFVPNGLIDNNTVLL